MAAQRPAYISPSAQDIVDGGCSLQQRISRILANKMTVDQPISYPVTDASDPQKALMRQYDPTKVLNHPDFKVLSQDEVDEYVKQGDKQVNLACAYNAHKQVHMVRKPDVKPGKGEVLIHVRATGICG